MAYDIDSMYDTLKEEIVTLQLLPGTKIKEEDLAFKFNVSRTPIRSVISRLAKDGLVDVLSQRGTYVSKIDIGSMKDYLFIRNAVELSIIREMASVITDDELKGIEEILKEQKVISEMDPSVEKSKRFYYNDNDFHLALYKAAGQESVWKLLYESTTPLNRARMISNLRETSDVQKVYEQHHDVYLGLKAHNEKKACEAMKKHFDEGFDGIDVIEKKYSYYFKGEQL